ncbi:hypothetical protein ACM66B_006011 [Microbotryomycetes sp. NB124-2]
MSASTADLGPVQVDATLQRLLRNPNVKGVLILSRQRGIIIKSAGALFSQPTSASSNEGPITAASQPNGSTTSEPDDQGSGADVKAVANPIAVKYAATAARLVETVHDEVNALDDVEDALRFLRIRTRHHELIITPDENYILTVVQELT